MDVVSQTAAPSALPEGYRTIALEPDAANSSLQLCVVLKDTPDVVGGMLIALGETADATVYLGCLLDAGRQVHQWLEVWIQNIDRIEQRFPGHVQSFGNEMLDRRWVQRAARFRAGAPEAHFVIAGEKAHPLPLFLTRSLDAGVHPRDQKTGEPWSLATNDEALRAAGLPPFSTSLARYLTVPAAEGEEPRFIPVTPGAPTSGATVDLQTGIGSLMPINPAAGLMMVRSFSPIALGEWFDLLAGCAWRGIEHGKRPFTLTGVYRTLQNEVAMQQGAGHFLLAAQGRAGRLLETFHLKLQAIRAAFALVREWVAQEQLPFLNLRAESFRVRIGEISSQLPFLWNSVTTLALPGEAVALPVESTEARHFAPPVWSVASVYRPTAGAPVQGTGTLRVREVKSTDDGTTTVHGTLSTQERVPVAANDLLCLRCTLPSGRLELYGRWDSTEVLSSNELRFRTLPRKLSEAVLISLRETGVAVPNVAFETLPVLSTPCDLHALAAIAVQGLLSGSAAEMTLPVALDEVFSFAAKIAEHAAQSGETGAAQFRASLQATLDEDSKWQETLGPQNLLADRLSPEEAALMFPNDIWWETIELVIRCFPGAVPHSFSRDLGDAPSLALERVFDEPLAHLDSLLLRTRSLISIDWSMNREIRSVINQVLSRP